MNKNTNTFIGFDNEYSESKIVVFGSPFDGTTSFRPGTRFAPEKMRLESYGLETYSPYQDKDLEDINVFDSGDLEFPFGNTNKVLDIIKKNVTKIIEDFKIPLMIGGEHLVSLPSIEAAYNRYKDLCVLHFDAHADLRDDYLGEKLSHATVIRRVWDIIGDNKIFQFGIRSGDKEEFLWAKNHTSMNKFNLNSLEKIIDLIGQTPVYVTIDLDIIDPSILSGTGTPEPGGVNFNDLINNIIKLNKLNIVGADIVELSPHYDNSGVSTIVACKVLRELVLAIY